MTVDLGLPSVTAPAPAGRLPSTRSRRLAAVRDGMLGSVHSWELVTAVDGPGTRLTIFLAGCALRCQYCHNPDTWRIRHGKDTPLDEVLALTGDNPLLEIATGHWRRRHPVRRRAVAATRLRPASLSALR